MGTALLAGLGVSSSSGGGTPSLGGINVGGIVQSAVSSIESLFGAHPLTPAQKNDFRLQRVAQLFTCARLGNLLAAQVLLDMATTQDEAAYPPVVQAAASVFGQLSGAMQSAARAAGPAKDTRTVGYCPENNALDTWAPGLPIPSAMSGVPLRADLATVTPASSSGLTLTTAAAAPAGTGGSLGFLVLVAAIVVGFIFLMRGK